MSSIEKLEMSLEVARDVARKGRLALSLADVPAFKELVLDGYFRDEAARLARISSDPRWDEEQRANILRDMSGVGAFQRYLQQITRLGDQAEREIETFEDTLNEMRAEEAEPVNQGEFDYAGSLGA